MGISINNNILRGSFCRRPTPASMTLTRVRLWPAFFLVLHYGKIRIFQPKYYFTERIVKVAQSCPTLCDPMDCSTQASLSITNSQSLPKPMSIESVMPSIHLISRPLLLLPSIFPSIRVFSSESALCITWPKHWSFSFSISPFNEHSGSMSFKGGLVWPRMTIWLVISRNLKKPSFRVWSYRALDGAPDPCLPFLLMPAKPDSGKADTKPGSLPWRPRIKGGGLSVATTPWRPC